MEEGGYEPRHRKSPSSRKSTGRRSLLENQRLGSADLQGIGRVGGALVTSWKKRVRSLLCAGKGEAVEDYKIDLI